METLRPTVELPLIHRHKGVLPAIFGSISLETKITPNFEWLNAEIYFKNHHFLTLEAIPGSFVTGGIIINHRFNSPHFKGLERIEDQVAEFSEYLEKIKVVHILAKSEETQFSRSGYGIVIPFGDKERNVAKVINLVWGEQKEGSDLETRSWELRNGGWAHTSLFTLKAMGVNPQITLG